MANSKRKPPPSPAEDCHTCSEARPTAICSGCVVSRVAMVSGTVSVTLICLRFIDCLGAFSCPVQPLAFCAFTDHGFRYRVSLRQTSGRHVASRESVSIPGRSMSFFEVHMMVRAHECAIFHFTRQESISAYGGAGLAVETLQTSLRCSRHDSRWISEGSGTCLVVRRSVLSSRGESDVQQAAPSADREQEPQGYRRSEEGADR